ncbi:MAG: hypothetical protein R2747_07435 [Pyrinomonadaceae bacterium]
MIKRLWISFVIILSTGIYGFAQQRPLLTEDVDITPPGSFNIAAGVEFTQNEKFPLSGLKGDLTRVGDIRVRIGLSSNVELQVEGTLQNFLAVNSVGDSSPIPLNLDGNSTNDAGDFTVATKIKLRNETENWPALGFKVGFQLPNTDQARGIGTNQINIFGKVLVQKQFGRRPGKDSRVKLYGNVGLGILTAPLEQFTQNDVFLYGLAGNVRFNDRINIVSEVNGRLNTRRGNAPLGTESIGQFRIGTQIKASGLRFDTAAIFGLTKFSPRSGITFGVTYQSPTIFTPAQ